MNLILSHLYQLRAVSNYVHSQTLNSTRSLKNEGNIKPSQPTDDWDWFGWESLTKRLHVEHSEIPPLFR